MATADVTFVVTVPEDTAWNVVSALAQFYAYPTDPTDQSKQATITAFVRQKIAAELGTRVATILTARATEAAVAAVTPSTPPTITITVGTAPKTTTPPS